MKAAVHISLILFTLLQACEEGTAQREVINHNALIKDDIDLIKKEEIIIPDGQILQTRILPPAGFQRLKSSEGSFAHYLRNLPLKPHNSQVVLYNGDIKPNNNIYDAVVDLEIGTKDLHQCADAIMRLRAEYLWNQKQYDKIHFNFTNGFRVDYKEWMKEKRIVVKGNSTYWTEAGNPSNTYNYFWEYMEFIFSYAGTLSLSKELTPVNMDSLRIGDIFIRGGSPGHAVVVIDIAISNKTNKKVFLLAQSYMPAQEIQILKNPNDATISPWYSLDFEQKLITPEWTFNKLELKRFEE